MDLYRKNLQKNLSCIYTKKIPEGFETLFSSNDYIFKAFCYRKKNEDIQKKKKTHTHTKSHFHTPRYVKESN